MKNIISYESCCILWMCLFLECLGFGVYPNEHPGVTLTRHRRYLLYPDGDPARVQLIIGIGLPVDLEDISVTAGCVIKMLYHIPMNSTEYTKNFYDSAANVAEGRSHRGHRSLYEEKSQGKELIVTPEADGTRYSEGGNIFEGQKEEVLKKRTKPPLSRWDMYTIFENMIERNGMSGRACILRTICEVAETPFTYHNGLLGELAHILFTPSSSRDLISRHTDNEYHAAEKLGADPGSDCGQLFSECNDSILDMFSEIALPSMHGFL